MTELREMYEQRARDFASQARSYEQRGRLVGNLRGLSFAVLAVGLGYGLSESSGTALLVGLAAAVAFAGLVSYHDKVEEREQRARRSELVNQHSLKRITGQWHDLPKDGTAFADPHHPYADDLDLFGKGSLYQRISVAHTRFGQERLASWLVAPASVGEISARQEAVIELAPQMAFRQDFEAEAMALVQQKRGDSVVATQGPDPSRLLRWVADERALPGKQLTVVLAWLLPLATTLGIVLQVLFDVPPYGWLIPLLLGLALLTATRHVTTEAFAAVSTTEGAFLRYGALLAQLENLEVVSPWLAERKRQLQTRDDSKATPSEVMRRFRRLVGWFDLRHNGMVYPFVNAFLLWDIHCAAALHRWRSSAGIDLDRWFRIIGDFEAICSLAALRHDEPQAAIPRIVDLASRDPGIALEGKGVGHVLLPADRRVVNDVEGFGPGQALLVTGSNMSGKSTFLRALGVNLVLGLAGAPVCASSMRLPHCTLGSSIRISDSLASGVSHFYREVQRLSWIVEQAHQEKPVFFLLDEVLHGTNSKERQVGARWVLRELLARGGFGVVTTHDMELCRLPDNLMDRVRQHHFRESVDNDEMTFDYRLRSGPVDSGNALRLMRLVGLDVPLDEE